MADPLSKPEQARRRRWYQEPRARWRCSFCDFPAGIASICQEMEWEARIAAMQAIYEEGDPRREWIRQQMEAWRERHERDETC